jgi:fused-like protein
LKFVAKAGKSFEELSALRTEVSILRRLDHENIVLLLDFFETARDVVLVTEFAHGELLSLLAADGALPCETVRSVAIQLVSALRYLAQSRVMHRDLKPQNCLIGSRGIIKLADFGFARELGTTSTLLSSIKGTPLYMAPEMLAPRALYTESADVWGLGVLIFELAAGRPPFYATSLAELVDVIITPTPPPIPLDWDIHLSSFIRSCLERSPERRPTWDALALHPFIIKDAH